MASQQLDKNPRFHLELYRPIWAAISAYSAAAILEVATSGLPSLELKIAAASFAVSLSSAMTQFIVSFSGKTPNDPDREQRDKEFEERLYKSNSYPGIAYTPLVGVIIGTTALLAHISVWLLAPFLIPIMIINRFYFNLYGNQ